MLEKERVCNQCRKQRADHKKSHIIPEFIFRSGNIYDGDDHNLIYFDISKDTDMGRTPTAPYEKYIFCKKCEKYHSTIESLASRAIFHDSFNPSKIFLTKRGLLATKEYEEVDPDSLKLFLILLLFRADLSKRNPFNQVSLGPYHEKFRQIMNQEREVSNSGCHFYLYNFNNLIENDMRRLCSPFFRMRVTNKKAYTFFVAGMGIIYHFNSPTLKLLEGSEITGEKGTKINLITKKKAAKILLTSTFNLPEYLVNKMLYK